MANIGWTRERSQKRIAAVVLDGTVEVLVRLKAGGPPKPVTLPALPLLNGPVAAPK